MKRGFTLVELLVVIAILGLLASFVIVGISGSRAQSRDTRRIADLRIVQNALQIFYLKCGFYPGSYINNSCVGGVKPGNPNLDPSNWSDLRSVLVGAKIGVGDDAVPNDPELSVSYGYYLQLGDVTDGTPKGQCYILRANLEKSENPALNKDLDDQDLITKLLPQACASVSCKNLYPSDPSCGIQGSETEYCVGNGECFYGG